MDAEIRLRLAVDGAATVSQDINQVSQSLQKIGPQTQSLDGLQQAKQAMQDLARHAQSVPTQVLAGGVPSSSMNSMLQAKTHMEQMAVGVRGLSMLWGGAMAIGATVDAIRQMASSVAEAALSGERLRTMLGFISGGQAPQEMAYLKQTTQSMGLEFTSSARAYAKFQAAVQGTSMEGGRARSVFEAVAQASSVMGMSADESSRAFLALGQMASKGTVQAEELRGQLAEAMPSAYRLAAKAMGVTTAELSGMLERGEVIASDFLPRFAAALREHVATAADSASKSLNASVNRMNGAWQSFMDNVGQAFSPAMKSGADAISADLSRLNMVMDESRARGHGLAGQLNAVAGHFIATAFGLNYITDQFTRAQIGLGAPFEPLLVQQEKLRGSLEKLRAQAAASPQGGGFYLRAEVAETERTLARVTAQLQALKLQSAVAGAGAGRGNGASELDARNAYAREEEEKRSRRAQALGVVVQRLSGIQEQYSKSLSTLNASYQAGELPLERYRDLVKKLIDTEGGGKALAAKGKENADKARATANAEADGLAQALKAGSQARLALIAKEHAETQHWNTMGLMSQREFAAQTIETDRKKLAEQADLISRQLAIEQGRPAKKDDPASSVQHANKIADLQAQLAAARQAQETADQAGQWKLAEVDLSDARQQAQQWAQLWQSTADGGKALSEQLASAQAAMLNPMQAPLAAAQAQADATVRRMQDQAESVRISVQNMLDGLRAKADAERAIGNAPKADQLSNMADALQSQQDKNASANAKLIEIERMRAATEYLRNATDGLNAGWSQLGKGVGSAAQALQSLVQEQQAYAAAVISAGANQAMVARVQAQHQQQELTGLASLANASKGMFKERTAGYRLLDGAERGFRAAEMAMALKNTAQQLGLMSAVTTAKVASTTVQAGAVVAGQAVETTAVTAGEAARNAAKVPGVYMAFMSALGPYGAAAAGVAIAAVLGGAFGGGGGSADAGNTGTGTVLGDSGAQSQSVTNSLAQLRNINADQLGASGQMLAALRNIDANTSGLGALLVQSGALSVDGWSGINTGFKTDAVGNLLDKSFQSVSSIFDSLGPLVGGVAGGLVGGIGKLLSSGFGSSTSITGQGLMVGPQDLGAILKEGLQAQLYADTETKKKSFWVTTGTSRDTQTQEAGSEIERQLSTLFGNAATALTSAATALHVPLDEVNTSLNSFVVDLGKIDLKGLSDNDIKDKLSAVFSAELDQLASATMDGLESFQHVGEGYLQTVVRVASGAEQAGVALRGLGVSMVDLMSVTNVQADDVGAELVRQSLVAKESGSAVGQIITQLEAGATDLASAYRGLVDARTALSAMGLNGDALSVDLLAGAGGMDALQSSLSAYQELVLSDVEQQAVLRAQLTQQFGALGLTLPRTVADFRQLVEGLGTSGASGQELLGQVLSLSKGFGELASSQEQAVQALASAGKGIQDFINDLRGVSSASATLATLRAAYQVDLVAAQAGDAEASQRVSSSAKALADALKANATDPIELARETARLAGQLQSLPAVAAYTDSLSKTATAAAAAAIAVPQVAAAQTVSAPVASVATGGAAAPAVTVVSGGAVEVPAPPSFDGWIEAQAGTTAEVADLRRAVQALHQELAAMRSEQYAAGHATAAAVGRTARLLDAITPDGDALAIRMAT